VSFAHAALHLWNLDHGLQTTSAGREYFLSILVALQSIVSLRSALDSSIGLASVFGVYVGQLSKGRKLYPENPKTNAMVVGCYAVLYICWTVLFLLSQAHPGLGGLTMTMCFATGSVLGLIRVGFRAKHNLRSNYIADWMTGTFLWPQVLAQMRLHCIALVEKPKKVVCKGKTCGNDDGDLENEGQTMPADGF
jgi:hypothetical protein